MQLKFFNYSGLHILLKVSAICANLSAHNIRHWESMVLINLSKDEIEKRIARFTRLSVLDSQKGHDIPQAVADLIWSRELLPVVAREEEQSPLGSRAPIPGAGDMSITYAE